MVLPFPSLIFPTASDRPGFWSIHHSFLTSKSDQFSLHSQKYLHTATLCLVHRSTDERLADIALFGWHLSDSQGQPQTRQPGCPSASSCSQLHTLHLSDSLMSYVLRLPTGRLFTTCFQWLLPCAVDSSPSDSVLVWRHFSTVSPYLCHFASPFFLLMACTFVFYLFPSSSSPHACSNPLFSSSQHCVSTISPAVPIYSKQAFLASSLPFVLLNLGTVSYLIIISVFHDLPLKPHFYIPACLPPTPCNISPIFRSHLQCLDVPLCS